MAKGISLHIGLNFVDPAKYDGWDGELAGCINDANDMEAIARSQGFETSIMIDGEATASAVIEAIGRAAQRLSAGDIFVLTYSGHGGQVTDENGDEEDGQDETWVLYDRMLLDDELYQLWSQFASGVRMFMLSDSCHSGTVAKVREYQQMLASAPVARQYRTTRSKPPKMRIIDEDVRDRVYARNRDLYKAIQWTSGRSERSAINASLILISGCQDNQLSADGSGNGLFTGTLKQVWNNGNFSGSYYSFYQQIADQMPPSQSPNFYTVGLDNNEFEAQTPFSIEADGVTPQPDDGTTTRPSVTGPSSWARDAGTPRFQVTTGRNRYYVFAISSSREALLNYNLMTEANSYTTWDDSSAPDRHTESSYTLPAAAWERLKNAGELHYFIGTTTNQNSWDGWEVSDTRTMSVTGVQDDTTSGPTVTGPSEWRSDDAAPQFDVTTSRDLPYYVFVMSSDINALSNYNLMTEANSYATWNDSSAPARHTESSYTLPDQAWERLRDANELHYFIGVTRDENTWDGWQTSAFGRMTIAARSRPPVPTRGEPVPTRGNGGAEDDPFATSGWSDIDPRTTPAAQDVEPSTAV